MEVEGKLKYKSYKNLPKQSETKRRDKQKCACCIDEKQPNEGVTKRNDERINEIDRQSGRNRE